MNVDNKSLKYIIIFITISYIKNQSFTCAMTPKMPAYSWRNYDTYNDQYKLYAICGPGVSGVSVNFNNLDRSCTSATIKCGSDLQCVQQQVTYDPQSGTRLVYLFNITFFRKNSVSERVKRLKNFILYFRPFCRGNFNLLVNPNPGSAGWYGYNGASIGVNTAYCTVYCT